MHCLQKPQLTQSYAFVAELLQTAKVIRKQLFVCLCVSSVFYLWPFSRLVGPSLFASICVHPRFDLFVFRPPHGCTAAGPAGKVVLSHAIPLSKRLPGINRLHAAGGDGLVGPDRGPFGPALPAFAAARGAAGTDERHRLPVPKQCEESLGSFLRRPGDLLQDLAACASNDLVFVLPY